MRKGIILAGGEGTRLYPLTKNTSKQLLPIYNKPMIYYPLSVLMLGGINKFLIITTPRDSKQFKELLGDGSQWNITIDYEEQSKPNGIAEAFLIAEKWLDNSDSVLILGDNLFFGSGLSRLLKKSFLKDNGASIFLHKVTDPERFGVAELNQDNKILKIIEKPTNPVSNWAVTGLYCYDKYVTSYVKYLRPTESGELEITELNNIYIKNNKLTVEFLGRDFTWLDVGTHESLKEANILVKKFINIKDISIPLLDNIKEL